MDRDTAVSKSLAHFISEETRGAVEMLHRFTTVLDHDHLTKERDNLCNLMDEIVNEMTILVESLARLKRRYSTLTLGVVDEVDR